QLGRLGALKHAPGIHADLAIDIQRIDPIAHQPAGLRIFAKVIGGRHPIASREAHELLAAPAIAVTPVMLPLDRLRPVTRPTATGSSPVWNTIGMLAVAFSAARAAALPEAAITLMLRSTNSAAKSGSLSYLSSAQRYSIVTF